MKRSSYETFSGNDAITDCNREPVKEKATVRSKTYMIKHLSIAVKAFNLRNYYDNNPTLPLHTDVETANMNNFL